MNKKKSYTISKSLKEVWKWKQNVSDDLSRLKNKDVIKKINSGKVRK